MYFAIPCQYNCLLRIKIYTIFKLPCRIKYYKTDGLFGHS